LLFANISIVIHFGINPDKGGRPPKDRRRTGIMACNIGALDINLFISIFVDVEYLLKIKKIGAINIE